MVQNNSFKKFVRNVAEHHDLPYSSALSKLTSEPEQRYAVIISTLNPTNHLRTITGFASDEEAWKSGAAMKHRFASVAGIDVDLVNIRVGLCPINITPEAQFNLFLDDYFSEWFRLVEIFESVGEIPDDLPVMFENVLELRVIIHKTKTEYSTRRVLDAVEVHMGDLFSLSPYSFVDGAHPDYSVLRIFLAESSRMIDSNSRVIDDRLNKAIESLMADLYKPLSPIPMEIPEHVAFIKRVL